MIRLAAPVFALACLAAAPALAQDVTVTLPALKRAADMYRAS